MKHIRTQVKRLCQLVLLRSSKKHFRMCKCPQRLSFRTTTHQHTKNLFPQSWLREISSLQFSILVPLSSLVLWIESYSIYSLCFSSHPGVQNFLWQQKAQSPKQTENSSPKIKQLPVNSGIFYRNVPSPSICYTFKRTHCSI